MHALQGHPESGKLFQRHIDTILTSPELNFRATVLDRCLYRTEYKGETVLLLRQVDDFALSCNSETIANEIFCIIGKKLQLPNEDKPHFEVFGLLNDFNGVLLEQRQGYIKIHCSGYIDRLLRTHKCDTDTSDLSSRHTSPLPDDAIRHLYRTEHSVQEGSTEHHSLEKEMGFSYPTLLGELMYAYISCRPGNPSLAPVRNIKTTSVLHPRTRRPNTRNCVAASPI